MPCRTAIGAGLRLILASASPRRVALLDEAGVEFDQQPANVDESPRPGESPEAYVSRLAEAKARASWKPGCRSLGADTIVTLDGVILGKPRDPTEARVMLRHLSGRSHEVLTGVAVFDGNRCSRACERTEVRFRDLADSEIDAYVASGEPMDKAGSYAIQGGASAFVRELAGSYSNVVGLPVSRVLGMLR